MSQSGSWYYAQSGTRIGPFTFEQFRQMAGSGRLQPDDMVWNEGSSQWISANAVAGLFAGGSSVAKPNTVPRNPALPLPPTTNTPETAKKQRSVFWVVSTHVLTTGFAMPALAVIIGWGILNVTQVGPFTAFLILLALQTLGYIGGAFYSLSYIRKAGVVQRPLACIKPSIITFVVLVIMGFMANVATLLEAQQNTHRIGAIIALLVADAVIILAFASITHRGFADMERLGAQGVGVNG